MQAKAYFPVLCLLYSASMWGLIWYPLRLLEQAGLSGVWTTLVMYLVAGLTVLPFYTKRNKGRVKEVKTLILLGIAAGVTNLAFIIALIEGDVMRVMLLFYLSPIWSVLIGRFWLKEQISTLSWGMFFTAIIGSLIMLWNPEMGAPWPQGTADWLALLASLAFSVHNVLSHKLGHISMLTRVSVVWWGVFFVALLTVVLYQPQVPEVSFTIWSAAALLGLFAIVTMTIAVLHGLANMPVHRSAVIMLFELVVAAISAWLLSHEVMTTQEWMGGLLILVAGLIMARASRA